jgi:hypothetical protein
MAGLRFRGIVGFLAAGSLLLGSTAAVAAESLPAPEQGNPWATLSVLSGGAPAAALCGAAAAAAAQTTAGGCVLPVVDTPPPVAQSAPPTPVPIPPIAGPPGSLGFNPLLLALAAVAAGVGIYFLTKNKGHGNSAT